MGLEGLAIEVSSRKLRRYHEVKRFLQVERTKTYTSPVLELFQVVEINNWPSSQYWLSRLVPRELGWLLQPIIQLEKRVIIHTIVNIQISSNRSRRVHKKVTDCL